MRKYIMGFTAGFVAALCMTSVIIAQPVYQTIPVVFNNIKVFVDGKQIPLFDSKQRPIEPFGYNDTVYLPARAIANALGKEVSWDQKNTSVYIGTPPEAQETVQPGKVPELEGIKLFPADNLWNTPVDNLKVHPKSDEYINSIGRNKRLHPDFGTFWDGSPIGIPYNIVPSSQPKVKVTFDYDDESDKGPYPIPDNPLIEGGSDRHMLILQKDTNMLYELYNAEKRPDGSWHAGSGAIWRLDRNEYRPRGWTSADAAGLAILPGLVRWDEVYQKGEINHAFRVTLSKIQKAYIPPASHSGGRYTDDSYPPMGLRLRLKADFDISGFDKDMQVILKAMKKYGLIVADVGSDMYVSGTHDTRWDDEALNALKSLKAGDFEAVYTGEPIPY